MPRKHLWTTVFLTHSAIPEKVNINQAVDELDFRFIYNPELNGHIDERPDGRFSMQLANENDYTQKLDDL